MLRSHYLAVVCLALTGSVELAIPFVARADIFGRDKVETPWCGFRRAGNPHCVAPWARCTYGSDYCGYYVGGGAPFHGESRCPDEGTFGMDYKPWFSRVRLDWWHGRYQGGQGQYEPNALVRPFRQEP